MPTVEGDLVVPREYALVVESLAQDAFMAHYLDGDDTSEEFSALVGESERLAVFGIVSGVDFGRVSL